MLTQRQVTAAIVKRNRLAGAIRGCGAWGMSFDQCFKLCPQQLREEYVAANRVACFMEEEIIAKGRAYKLKAGGLVWRSRARWAPRIVGTK